MSDKVSLPILAGGKFTGRALTHINELADSKVNELETKAFEAIDRKADQATFDTFLNTVTNQISDSEARTALAGVQAAVGAERSAREEADTRLAGRVTALEEAEPDLSGYATKEELATAVEGRSDKLTVYSGGSVNLGEATAGKMLGYLVKTPGTIAGQDILPGEVWVFVADGESWTPFQAGAGGGGGAVPVNPADSAPPVAGTLTSTSTADTTAKVIVTGASDETGLAQRPYSFRFNGGDWSAWVASQAYTFTGLPPASSVTLQHRVQDVGGNITEGAPITVQTTALATPAVATWRYSSFDNASKQSYTFSAVPLGEASPTRTVLMAVGYRGTSAQGNGPSVSVGGISATRVNKPEDPRLAMSSSGGISLSDIIFYTATVPSGDSADIVVSHQNAPFREGVQVWTFPTAIRPVSSTNASSWVSPASIGLLPTEKQAVVGAGVVSPTAMVSVDAEHTAAGSSNSIIGWEENGAAVTQEVTNGGVGGYVAAVWEAA